MTTGELFNIGVNGVVPVHWDLSKADADPGSLEGWASVYNVVDRQGDILLPGSFADFIKTWRSTGQSLPLALDHQHNADGIIGSVTALSETPYGLKFKAVFSADADAQKARAKAKEGHLKGISVYGLMTEKEVRVLDGEPVRFIRKADLVEISLTGFPVNAKAMATAVKGGIAKAVSDKPWSDFSQVDYTPQQWRSACLIDTGEGDVDSKARYKLPVKEPSGTVNRNGAHAAAGALAGARTPLSASAEQKASAARKLVAIYRTDLKEDPPDSLLRMAGMSTGKAIGKALTPEWVADMKAALAISQPEAAKAAVDVLVKSMYSVADVVDPVIDPDESQSAPDGIDNSDLDDASLYALSIIGDTGASTGDPIDDLLAEISASQVSDDLDALAAEVESNL